MEKNNDLTSAMTICVSNGYTVIKNDSLLEESIRTCNENGYVVVNYESIKRKFNELAKASSSILDELKDEIY